MLMSCVNVAVFCFFSTFFFIIKFGNIIQNTPATLSLQAREAGLHLHFVRRSPDIKHSGRAATKREGTADGPARCGTKSFSHRPGRPPVANARPSSPCNFCAEE